MSDINCSVPMDLASQIYNLAGRENGKKIVDLLMNHGLEIIAKVNSIGVSLPNIEIKTLSRTILPAGLKTAEMVRRHEFICTINGKTLPIQKVELDPFDYSDASPFNVKITLNVLSSDKGDQKCVIQD